MFNFWTLLDTLERLSICEIFFFAGSQCFNIANDIGKQIMKPVPDELDVILVTLGFNENGVSGMSRSSIA